MNIYKISPIWDIDEADKYDLCIAAIVAAESEQDAATIYPGCEDGSVNWCSKNQHWFKNGEFYETFGYWVKDVNRVKVELIATNTTQERGLILESAVNG